MKQPDAHQLRVLLIGNWLSRFAAIYPMYGKTLQPERFDQFLDTFKDTPPEDLDYAFQKTRTEHTGEFPTPADVMKRLREREKDEYKFEAEKAWDALIWMLRRFGTEEGFVSCFHAIMMPSSYKPFEKWLESKAFNGGFLIRPTFFSRQMDRAIERVGGLNRIRQLSTKDHDFVRKDFLEVYTRYTQTQGFTELPGRQEAKQIIDNLKELADGSD